MRAASDTRNMLQAVASFSSICKNVRHGYVTVFGRESGILCSIYVGASMIVIWQC